MIRVLPIYPGGSDICADGADIYRDRPDIGEDRSPTSRRLRGIYSGRKFIYASCPEPGGEGGDIYGISADIYGGDSEMRDGGRGI